MSYSKQSYLPDAEICEYMYLGLFRIFHIAQWLYVECDSAHLSPVVLIIKKHVSFYMPELII